MSKGIYLPERPYYAINFAAKEQPKTIKSWLQFKNYETEIFALMQQDDEYFLFHRKTYERAHWFGIKLNREQAKELDQMDFDRVSDFWEEEKYF